jgi:predicted esterase
MKKVAGLLLVSAALTLAAAPPGRDLQLSFRSAIDGTRQPYRLYVPSSYDGTHPVPLVFVLHGTGGNQNTLFDEPRYSRFPLRAAAGKRGVLLLSPHGRGTAEYRGVGETDIFEVLADVAKHYRVDPDRVYFTGHSMGGTGAAYLAMRHPDIPAAVVAFAPAYSFPWLVGNLARVPSWWMMGAADEEFYHQGVLPGMERMRSLGIRTRFLDIPGKGHEGPLELFDQALDWLLTFRRDPHPKSYRFDVDTPLHGRAWWTTVQKIQVPGRMASVEARASGRHLAEFTLTNVSQLLFAPDPEVFDLTRPLTVHVNGKRVFSGAIRAGHQLSLTPSTAAEIPLRVAPIAAPRTHPVATAPEPLDIAGDESPLGSWIADAMRASTGADIALYNRRHYRGLPIPKGTVDIVDLIQCSRPFDQFLVTARLTGAAIGEILDTNAADNEHLVQVSGVRYKFDAARPAGQRVLSSTLDPGREYLVVFEGQVPERETVYLAGRYKKLPFTLTGTSFTLALYGHAAKLGTIRAARDGRVQRVAPASR